MRKYELTYLVSDEVQESDLNKVTGKVSGYIVDLGGKIDKEDIWGRRKLVYPIKKQDFATYVTVYFELPAEKINEFDRDLRLTKGVIRQLLMVKEYGEETLTLTSDEIAGTADIEEIVGKKAFEAIEGETEESKDLMAVRGTEDEVESEKLKVESADQIEEPEKVAEETLEESPAVEETKKTVKKAPTIEENVGVPTESVGKVVVEKPSVSAKAPVSTKASQGGPSLDGKKVSKKLDKAGDEVDRLTKLNEELDDILKDEL